MKRINTGLLLSALVLGSVALLGSTPARARPVIVERLAEINARGTEKDHGGLAFSTRSLSDTVVSDSGFVQRPQGVWTASGDGFGIAGEEVSAGRPTIVQRLAELNARGVEKDHGGLAFSSRTVREFSESPTGVWTASGDGFGVAGEEMSAGRPAIVQRLAEINAAGTEKDHGGLSFSSRTLSEH